VIAPRKSWEEALIRRSGLRYIFLHNGPYIEPFAGELGNVPHALETDKLVGSAGDGKLSGASREDLAEAAAVALMINAPGDVVYELGGTAFTMADVAQAISILAGKPLVYENMPVEQYSASLVAAGYPQSIADIAAEGTFASQRGDWYTESMDLQRLLGQPSTPLISVVEATLRAKGCKFT
jgi:NAD(P)H dehydrogenase (quinone)